MSYYRSMRLELTKIAEEVLEPQQPQPEPTPAKKPPHPLLTMGRAVGTFGLGTLAGDLAIQGANQVSKGLTGQRLVQAPAARVGLPLAAGVGTMLFDAWQRNMMDKVRVDSAERRRLHDERSQS